MSGLASLTANYTDSEDEDQPKHDDDDENTRDSVTFPSGVPSHLIKSATGTPNSDAASAKSTPKQKQLVSYGDIQDENDDKDAEPVPMELESDEEAKETESKEEVKESLNRYYYAAVYVSLNIILMVKLFKKATKLTNPIQTIK